MNEMAATAEQLRRVEDAFQQFLMRWAVDELMNDLANGDRIHGDIVRATENFSNYDRSYSNYRAGMDD